MVAALTLRKRSRRIRIATRQVAVAGLSCHAQTAVAAVGSMGINQWAAWVVITWVAVVAATSQP